MKLLYSIILGVVLIFSNYIPALAQDFGGVATIVFDTFGEHFDKTYDNKATVSDAMSCNLEFIFFRNVVACGAGV